MNNKDLEDLVGLLGQCTAICVRLMGGGKAEYIATMPMDFKSKEDLANWFFSKGGTSEEIKGIADSLGLLGKDGLTQEEFSRIEKRCREHILKKEVNNDSS